jgi:hypothetical protein
MLATLIDNHRTQGLGEKQFPAATTPGAYEWKHGRLVATDRDLIWAHDGETLDGALKASGFNQHPAILISDPGDPLRFELFENSELLRAPAFVASVELGYDTYRLVFFDGLAEVLEFLAWVTPLAQALNALSERAEAIEAERSKRPGRAR